MQIQTKLFSAFFIFAAVLIVTIAAALQWSFDRGLLDYVNPRQLRQQQALITNLQAHYRRTGSWDDLNWRKQMKQAMGVASKDEAKSGAEHRPHVHHRPPHSDGFQYRDFRRSHADAPNEPHDNRRPSFKDDKPHRFPPPRGPKGTFRPTLLDADKRPLFGPYRSDFLTTPIKVDDQIVGWLALPPQRNLTDQADLNFRDHQAEILLLTALAALLVTVVAAMLLARQWTRPLRRLTEVSHQLASGHYEERADVRGNDEVAQLAKDINHLAHTLENNEAARKYWVASVSHELRTPLAVLRGEIEAILDGIRPANDNTLKSLQQEVTQLTRLVHDLYELSNADIGALRYHMETFDIVSLVDDAVEIHESEIRKAGMHLSWQCPSWDTLVEADPNRLQQVLDNLIHNACKYAGQGSQLRITLTAESDHIVILIEDSGPGVPTEALDKLFDHLYRVDASRNRQTGGSGLGLAICQKIIEAHQGSISAHHSQLGGLAIRIVLPKT